MNCEGKLIRTREGGREAVLCVRLLRFLFHSCSLCVSVTANQQ